MSYRLKYNTNNHNVYNINFHIVWITKYRKKFLKPEIQNDIINIIKEKASILDFIIKAIEVMPNHIHLFISFKPIHNISYIINILKGNTSFNIRNKYPLLKKYKALWTHSYFIESIGYINENTIIKYIENQYKEYIK